MACGECDAPRMTPSAVADINHMEGAPTMAKVRSWAGLDVHARSVVAVTLDAESGELRSARLPGETPKVVEFLGRSQPQGHR